ncbi:hypothetical protein M8C21_008331 [Ambrosia artemisiifolia]|uniref:Uncharacterized protein n=1 Tax=Ambrosia artemisiifolia TaxID=4212 RepID=A0AAD5C4U3_AMBAR|nr:hypothetical protein M8C21_008331 [Ambrosia artemisiifolia]
MISKMVNRCLNVSQHSVPHSPSSLKTLASINLSPSAKRRSLTQLVVAYRPAMFGTKLILNKSEPSSKHQPIKHVVNAILDENFSNDKENHNDLKLELELESESDWHGDMLLASTERKANSVDLPFSLRIIKKKKRCHNQIKELAGESAHSSVKKAFSSMVFILRELQTFTLQTIHLPSYEDLQAILVRVQSDMNASFVWLFQQVFSQTPPLMVSVMILLANYSVHSISNNFTTTSALPNVSMESVMNSNTYTEYNHSSMKTFCMNSGERTTSVGGNNGGGRKFKQVASGNDGNDKFDQFDTFLLENLGRVRANEEAVLGHQMNGGLDREMMKRFVSPVTARIEAEDVEDYLRTEVLYQMGLSQEPDNPLLLANYAQFLYVVARDYDRAEDYFKRASMVEPKDAEALNKYASFLWNVRKDLWAAEETYLEAISADPNNSFYAANYAHFLWNTGGEDTCFPLDSLENTFSSDV